MQLYVIRHAIADDPMPGEHDANRELTSEGVKRMKLAVRGMRKLDWKLDRVLTSPWLRAAQTAKLLAPLRSTTPIVTDLLIGPPRAELLAMIAENVGGETVAVVGHEPWLGELVAWLAFGDGRHGEALALRKSGIVWLQGTVVPGGMMIRAIVPPKLLRALR